MRNSSHRFRRVLALMTVVAAIAAPAAVAKPVDPPISGQPQAQEPQAQDQGYQGTVTALSPPVQSTESPQGGGNDSPYPGSVTALSPPVETPTTVVQTPSPVAGDGFDWGDAGIGASAMLALAAIAAGAAVVVSHRPRRSHTIA